MANELQIVTWLLVIAGWMIVNYFADKRETRKEARGAIDNAKKDVIKISALAVEYFTTQKHELAQDVKWTLDVLGIELARLKKFLDSSVVERFGEFHDECTGEDFESAQRRIHDHNSMVVRRIHVARNRLLAELERHFVRHYI